MRAKQQFLLHKLNWPISLLLHIHAASATCESRNI
eukprot:SAG25_NODE_71_length_17290_cov_41.467861_12_plen_35_part_00